MAMSFVVLEVHSTQALPKNIPHFDSIAPVVLGFYRRSRTFHSTIPPPANLPFTSSG